MVNAVTGKVKPHFISLAPTHCDHATNPELDASTRVPRTVDTLVQ